MFVEIYSKKDCNWCWLLKEKLTKAKITYTEYMVDQDVAHLDALREKVFGVKTVPQMFVDDRHVGNFDVGAAWIAGYVYKEKENDRTDTEGYEGSSDDGDGDDGQVDPEGGQ